MIFFRECFDARGADGVRGRAKGENLEAIQLMENLEGLMFQWDFCAIVIRMNGPQSQNVPTGGGFFSSSMPHHLRARNSSVLELFTSWIISRFGDLEDVLFSSDLRHHL